MYHCHKELADGTLGSIRWSVASSLREVIHSALLSLHLECCVLGFLVQERHGATGERGHWGDRVEQLSYKKKAERAGTVQPGEKMAWQGNLINVANYLKRGCKEDKSRLFSLMPTDRTRIAEHKLKHKGFVGTRGTPPHPTPFFFLLWGWLSTGCSERL